MVPVEGSFDGLHPAHLGTPIEEHDRPSNGLEQGPLEPEGYTHESNHQPLAPPFSHSSIKGACPLEARQSSGFVGPSEGLRFFAAAACQNTTHLSATPRLPQRSHLEHSGAGVRTHPR
jgi:hypothetical protein